MQTHLMSADLTKRNATCRARDCQGIVGQPLPSRPISQNSPSVRGSQLMRYSGGSLGN